MKFLELVEGADDIGFFGQFLCSLAQLGLDFQILAEIILPGLDVQAELVVELLHIVLVGLPQLIGTLLRDGLDFTPFLLETLELPWSQVLPQMLAKDPKERPAELSALAGRLSQATPSGALPARGLPSWKFIAMTCGGLAAAVAIAVASWFAFRSPVPSAAGSEAEGEFADAFSAEGIYEVQK